jgi:hypothetical protein
MEATPTEAPSTTSFVLLTFLLSGILYVILQIADYTEIRRNWGTYRCSPSIMPFAKFYGHDLEETVQFCVGQAVKEHAPGVIAPLYKGISEIATTVDDVYTRAEAVEEGIGGLLSGFKNFALGFENAMLLVAARLRMTFVAFKDIFMSVYGIFFAFIYAAISAITFGMNLVCNPLTVFIGTIAGYDVCCFTPETPIVLADNTTRPISSLKVGVRVKAGGAVTAVCLFDGSRASMVSVNGIHVSVGHYVLHDGKMISAGEHPDAIPVPSRPLIWCISTESHRLVAQTPAGREFTFADYEESSDPAVVAAAQRAAEEYLNGPGNYGPPVRNYGLGLHPDTPVRLANERWATLSDIRIGQRLHGGGTVTGIIHEHCEEIGLTLSGYEAAAAQLVRETPGKDTWRRVKNRWPTYKANTVFISLLTDTDDPITVSGMMEVRHFAETHADVVQTPYDAALRAKDPA